MLTNCLESTEKEHLLTKVLRKKTRHMFSITLSGWEVGGRTRVTEQAQMQRKGMSQDLKSKSFQLSEYTLKYVPYIQINVCITKS